MVRALLLHASTPAKRYVLPCPCCTALVRKRSIDVIVARHLQIASHVTGPATSMDLGWHQDNPHAEPSDDGRPQRRLIYAVPVVGSKAEYDLWLFNIFIAPTVRAFREHEAEVKLRRFTTRPLRLHRVFNPNNGGSKFGCAVRLICDVEASHSKLDRRVRTNEAKAKDPAASIIEIITTVRKEVAVETKARIDARVLARRRLVETPHRVSSLVAAGAGILSTLATAFSSPAFSSSASDIYDEEDAEEMELDTSSGSSARADEDAQVQEAIQESLKPANTSTLAVRKSNTTPHTIVDSLAPRPLPPKVPTPKLKPQPAASAPQGSILKFFARRN